MLHENGHHDVNEHELRRQHERHKVERRDELKTSVAAVVTAGTSGRALPQRVLGQEQYGFKAFN